MCRPLGAGASYQCKKVLLSSFGVVMLISSGGQHLPSRSCSFVLYRGGLTAGVFYRYPGMGVDAQALVPHPGKADDGVTIGIVNIIAAFLHFAQNNRHFTPQSVFYSYFNL